MFSIFGDVTYCIRSCVVSRVLVIVSVIIIALCLLCLFISVVCTYNIVVSTNYNVDVARVTKHPNEINPLNAPLLCFLRRRTSTLHSPSLPIVF